jgi:hypothetical protein
MREILKYKVVSIINNFIPCNFKSKPGNLLVVYPYPTDEKKAVQS